MQCRKFLSTRCGNMHAAGMARGKERPNGDFSAIKVTLFKEGLFTM